MEQPDNQTKITDASQISQANINNTFTSPRDSYRQQINRSIIFMVIGLLFSSGYGLGFIGTNRTMLTIVVLLGRLSLLVGIVSFVIYTVSSLINGNKQAEQIMQRPLIKKPNNWIIIGGVLITLAVLATLLLVVSERYSDPNSTATAGLALLFLFVLLPLGFIGSILLIIGLNKNAKSKQDKEVE